MTIKSCSAAVIAMSAFTTTSKAENVTVVPFYQSIIEISMPSEAALHRLVELNLKILNLQMAMFQTVGGADKVSGEKHIEMAKRGVLNDLKDPNSAEFYDLEEKGRGKIKYVCGKVNAKNSYGGYVGKRWFIAAGPVVKMQSGERDQNEAAFLHLVLELCLSPKYLPT